MSEHPLCSEHAAALASIQARLDEGDRRLTEYREDIREVKSDIKTLVATVNNLATERKTIASVAGLIGGLALWVLQTIFSGFHQK